MLYFVIINSVFNIKIIMKSTNAHDILEKSVKSGLSGAGAMTIQVSSLMWLRTTMNYQYKFGGKMLPTIQHLYKEGGVPRFYRGIIPALMVGPLSRFGDTAANSVALNYFKDSKNVSVPLFLRGPHRLWRDCGGFSPFQSTPGKLQNRFTVQKAPLSCQKGFARKA